MPGALTKEAGIDFLLDAGPRVFDPDVPADVRQAIGQSASLTWYRDALKRMAQNQVAEMHRDIEKTSRENRLIESTQEFKASNGLGYPKARIPLGVHMLFEELYGHGCWKDDAFMDDFLKHHPGLKLKVTRGTRGQEYCAPPARKPKIQNPNPNIIRGFAK